MTLPKQAKSKGSRILNRSESSNSKPRSSRIVSLSAVARTFQSVSETKCSQSCSVTNESRWHSWIKSTCQAWLLTEMALWTIWGRSQSLSMTWIPWGKVPSISRLNYRRFSRTRDTIASWIHLYSRRGSEEMVHSRTDSLQDSQVYNQVWAWIILRAVYPTRLQATSCPR